MSDELTFKQQSGAEAVLDGSIQWGEEVGIDPVLVHAITVPLAALRLGEQTADDAPLLRLNSIRFGVASWRQLGGQSFSFPNVVRQIEADGESHPVYDIYGSLRMGSEYHQVVMTRIAFGPYDGCSVAVSMEGSVRSVSQPALFNQIDFACDASLTVGAVVVRGDLGSATPPTLAEADELTQRLLRLEDYRPPRSQNGRAVLEPLCPDSGRR
ncbi:hypothetical protein [Nakamurella multipartita]|uniref:Uncharacterized protein n=1 Tax=Nakamurella multipartita (strain ATCC 700099 / DSM 44233 / CIP 104796 / JCM 9543 / NBRC 105858 / Y-104) TaxID=479431 RepID=C8X7P3_NAKMY|nr:hypothetical protein [Nakamurella multipartita]ACV78996.1 hypothetical protein Namu_2648 [Nakamurella multipartita DSM 44233]